MLLLSYRICSAQGTHILDIKRQAADDMYQKLKTCVTTLKVQAAFDCDVKRMNHVVGTMSSNNGLAGRRSRSEVVLSDFVVSKALVDPIAKQHTEE